MKKLVGMLFASMVLLSACGTPGGGGAAGEVKKDSKESDTIKIGLNLTLAPSIAELNVVSPSLCFLAANSTIKTAFLPSKPISITIATCA